MLIAGHLLIMALQGSSIGDLGDTCGKKRMDNAAQDNESRGARIHCLAGHYLITRQVRHM